MGIDRVTSFEDNGKCGCEYHNNNNNNNKDLQRATSSCLSSENFGSMFCVCDAARRRHCCSLQRLGFRLVPQHTLLRAFSLLNRPR